MKKIVTLLMKRTCGHGARQFNADGSIYCLLCKSYIDMEGKVCTKAKSIKSGN